MLALARASCGLVPGADAVLVGLGMEVKMRLLAQRWDGDGRQ